MATFLLGVRLDTFSRAEIIEHVRAAFTSSVPTIIYTPNPEMLVKAHNDPYFKEVLNKSTINICDGKGLQLFAPQKIERLAGVDLVLDLCQLAAEEGRGVYLLGSGNDGVLKRTADALVTLFPNLKIVGSDRGPEIKEIGDKRYDIARRETYRLSPIANLQIDLTDNDRVLEHIKQAEPSVLFTAFGMGKQEKWIHENLAKIPSVKVAMGVGGSFDFISGQTRRAPLLLRQLGLEWLWRLVLQPRRFLRIWNATARFTWLIIKKI